MVSFTGTYNYLIQLIPILIVAPLYFRGKIEFGQVTQSAMAFAQVLAALSLIITQFESLSSFAAVSDRVDAVVEAVERAQHRVRGSIHFEESEDRLAFLGLTLRPPHEGDADATVLVRNLTLDLPVGGNLLVVGPNPSGKHALFLSLAGVWQAGEGRVVHPPRGTALYVPRHPLSVVDSLRSQLDAEGRANDAALLEALEAVGFTPALERLGGLDGEQAEQAELAFARLLLARPRYAVIDHATEGLPPDRALELYAKLHAASIATIVFAEDASLAPAHDVVLHLDADGEWSIEDTHAAPIVAKA
jgi:putative ATP-binding cassette transporter